MTFTMKPIRILYDEWGFQETHGGVSRLFSEVMKNLPEGFEWVLPQVFTVNEYLHDAPFNVPMARLTYGEFVRSFLRGHKFPGSNRLYHLCGKLFPMVFPAHEVLNRRARMSALKRGEYDLYHLTSAHWYSYDWRVVEGRKPFVVTVCDLIPELIEHNEMMVKFRRPLLEAAAHVIAITEHTKSDLMRLYGTPADKISVVYLGHNMGIATEPCCVNELVGSPFVLFVGKRGGYKNFSWMVRAIAPLMKETGLKIFSTGLSFSDTEKELFSELSVTELVCQRFVSDAEMKWLFANAVCFIHPSLYEGFGIPILDAFAAGCPVVLARASCFPEVAQNAALYFDPRDDGSELRSCLRRVMTDSGLRETLIGAGLRRVREFSWQKCAAETATVYRRVFKEWKARS